MDLGCLDLCCVSVSDKQGTEATLCSSESREDSMSENSTASSKIGKASLEMRGKSFFLSFFFLIFNIKKI
jgi:hypothetical protein